MRLKRSMKVIRDASAVAVLLGSHWLSAQESSWAMVETRAFTLPIQEQVRPAGGLPSAPVPHPVQPLIIKGAGQDYAQPASHFPNPFAPYLPRVVAQARLKDTPLLKNLVKNGKIPLTLSDAVQLAIENNTDVAIARYNLDIADTDVMRAHAGSSLRGVSTGVVANTLGGSTETISGGGGPGGTSQGAGGSGSGAAGLVLSTNGAGPDPEPLDPLLIGTVQLERAVFPQSSELLNGKSTVGQNTSEYNFEYSQSFATGTALSVTFNNERVASTSARNLYSPALDSYMQTKVQQHLLQGFSRSLNQRFVVQAHNDSRITDESFRRQLLYTINQVENIYWALASAWEDVGSKERLLEQSTQLALDNRKQFEVGTLARLDVINADSEVASDRQALTSAQNNLEYQQMLMKQAVTRDLDDTSLDAASVIPTDRVSLELTEIEQTPLEELVKEAYATSPDVKQADLTVKNDEITLKALKNGLLPSIDLYASYGANAIGGLQNPNLTCGSTSGPFVPCPNGTASTKSYATTFSNLFNGSGPDRAIGVNFTIPLRNRTAQADQIRSELEYRQAKLRLQQIYTQIRLQIINDRFALSNDRAQVQSAKAAKEYAEQSLKAESDRFRLGDSTTAEVLQVQRTLAIADDNLISAKAAYARDRAALYQITATTLDEYGISFAGAVVGALPESPAIPGLARNAE